MICLYFSIILFSTNNYTKILWESPTHYYIKSPHTSNAPLCLKFFLSSLSNSLTYTKSKMINFVIPPCLSYYLVTLALLLDTALLSSLLYSPALLSLLQSVEYFSSPAMSDILKFPFQFLFPHIYPLSPGYTNTYSWPLSNFFWYTILPNLDWKNLYTNSGDLYIFLRSISYQLPIN